MSDSSTFRLVLTTASSQEEARKLATALLEPRLAACVNIIPGVESHYYWEGKLETGTEYLCLIKTSAEKFEEVAERIRQTHSYDCPEIVALNPRQIDPAFAHWWRAALEQDEADE